jgi:hypothetical protein
MSLGLVLQVAALVLGILGAGFLAYLFQQFSVGMYKPPSEDSSAA